MLIHWIWLATRPGVSDRQKKLLLESFDDPEDIFFAAKDAFDHIEGLTEEAKESLQETVEFLEHPDKYAQIGAKLPKGCLLVGPPGTGKTMAAQVMANELQMDLCRVDLSQVSSKYIGETAKNLEKIFREAEQSNVILFFDEATSSLDNKTEENINKVKAQA